MPEEIAYRRPGNSPETVGWNQHFDILIGEYWAAVEDGDEGLIANAVHEARKILGNLMQNGWPVILPTQNNGIVQILTNDPLEKKMALEPIIVEGISRETPVESLEFMSIAFSKHLTPGIMNRENKKIADLLKKGGLNNFGELLDYVNGGKQLLRIPDIGDLTIRRLSHFFSHHASEPHENPNYFLNSHPSFASKTKVLKAFEDSLAEVSQPEQKSAVIEDILARTSIDSDSQTPARHSLPEKATDQPNQKTPVKTLSIRTPEVPFSEKLALAVSGVDKNNKQLAERMFLQGGVLIL